jgi:hypothetical protein
LSGLRLRLVLMFFSCFVDECLEVRSFYGGLLVGHLWREEVRDGRFVICCVQWLLVSYSL